MHISIQTILRFLSGFVGFLCRGHPGLVSTILPFQSHLRNVQPSIDYIRGT